MKKFQAKLSKPVYKDLSLSIRYPINRVDYLYVFVNNNRRHYDRTCFTYYIDGEKTDWDTLVTEFNQYYAKEGGKWHYVKDGRSYQSNEQEG